MQYFELIWSTFSINLHPLGFYWILSSLRLTVPSEKCQSFGSPGTGLFYGARGRTMTALTQIGLSHPRTSEEPTLPFVAILSFVLTRAFCCPHGNPVRGLVQLPRGVPSLPTHGFPGAPSPLKRWPGQQWALRERQALIEEGQPYVTACFETRQQQPLRQQRSFWEQQRLKRLKWLRNCCWLFLVLGK